MQKLAEICIRRPVFATMIVLSLVVVGAAGFFKLGVDRFPAVDLPTVSVRVGLPGGAPEEVESLITQQVEEVINTVDGISELRSVSGQGTSIVIATFKLDRNLESAAQDVRDRVATLGRQLPEDATPPVVQKFDNDSTPVISLALTADRSLRELTELADKTVRPQLERVSGVGEVNVVGGLIVGNPDDTPESIQTNLDFAKRYIDWPYIQHPTPYPRTPMTKEFQERGLIINERLEEYDGTTAVVRSEHLSAEEIEFMRWRAERKMKTKHMPAALFHSPGFVLRNAAKMLGHTYRGNTWKSLLGMEGERQVFERYRTLRRAERVYI